MTWYRSGGGTDTSDATATASDIKVGKTAYVNDEKISGTFDFATETSGTATAENIDIGKTAWVNGSKVTGSKFQVCTWADGTDEQIANMLEAHYSGIIDIADYWSVGDKRTIHINAMSATGVSESHHADDYEFVIIGINHDDLTTPINGKTKSAITIQTDRILYKNTTDETYSSSCPESDDEGGYMNSSKTNSGGWTSCKRRTWCNNVFFNALPSWVQALVKPVNKLTSAGSQSLTINTTSDKVFLPSEIEVFGGTINSYSGEGTQYDYFKTTTNRYKKPTYKTYNSAMWWERSPSSSYSTRFCCVEVSIYARTNEANICLGLAPVCCM